MSEEEEEEEEHSLLGQFFPSIRKSKLHVVLELTWPNIRCSPRRHFQTTLHGGSCLRLTCLCFSATRDGHKVNSNSPCSTQAPAQPAPPRKSWRLFLHASSFLRSQRHERRNGAARLLGRKCAIATQPTLHLALDYWLS